MIKKRTLFVLGAGSSQPYGFPGGQALVDRICQKLDSPENSSWKVRLRAAAIADGAQLNSSSPYDVDQAAFDAFRKTLMESRLNSIDMFIERNPRYAVLGKRTIAADLIMCETDESLRAVKPELDWHRYLFNRLFPPRLDDYVPNLRVITFNFDRSFERALASAASATFPGAREAQIAEMIPVLHIHGQLCRPSWFSRSDDAMVPTRAYTDELTPESIRQSAKQLLLVHEEIERRSLLEEAADYLKWAERVCFLGLAYHEPNLRRLDVPHSLVGKAVYCLRYGMGDGPVWSAARTFAHEVKWYPRDWDIVRFLDETDLVHGG